MEELNMKKILIIDDDEDDFADDAGDAFGGHRFADIPNPSRHVGVLLDASALHAGRTGLESVKSVTQALVQAERYGTPVAQALRVLASESREMRMNAAEKKAASLPPNVTSSMLAPPCAAPFPLGGVRPCGLPTADLDLDPVGLFADREGDELQRIGSRGSAHYGELRGWPGVNQARIVSLSAHGIIARPIAVADNDGDLGHDGIGHRVHHFCPVFDNAGLLAAAATLLEPRGLSQ